MPIEAPGGALHSLPVCWSIVKHMDSGDGRDDGLTQRTVRQVINYIRSNRLRVGDELPGEMFFAQELGVSRTVTRAAFGALSALQLINVGNGRKPRVGQLDHSVMALSFEHAVRTEQMTIQEIWDVRRALELRAVVLAALRRTDEQAEQILYHAKAMSTALPDRVEVAQHDIAVHRIIGEATQNALFAHVIAAFGLVMENTITYLHRPSAKELELVIAQHIKIAECIYDRNSDEAMAAMNDHFNWSIRALFESGYVN